MTSDRHAAIGAHLHLLRARALLRLSATTSGVLYDIFRDGTKIGETCVTDQPAAAPPQVTPGQIRRAFRSLDWPASPLIVQPPGGRTLVNFATNFYTDNTTPRRQSITLLGHRVLIEATPTSYTWTYGDGTTAETTTPGAAYPALDVTHDYLRAGGVRARLDTTYSGRYRLDNGPWTTIPDTLTVTGTPVSLEVVEARPTLVAYD